MYKVFFNDRIVFVNSNNGHYIDSNTILSVIFNASDMHLAWQQFLDDPLRRNLFLTGDSQEKTLELFMQLFKIVEAAGGLVVNTQDQILCIYRWDRWDLPKGKIEKGETIKEAAVREVEEETGIRGVQLKAFKTTTYHIYASPYHNNKLILKPTHWFNMLYLGSEKLRPQLKEDIVRAEWFNKTDLDEVRNNTYSSLKELFDC
ncbi:MAG: NUDIX domain-containing protein [Prolixibacteraceae bacterium]